MHLHSCNRLGTTLPMTTPDPCNCAKWSYRRYPLYSLNRYSSTYRLNRSPGRMPPTLRYRGDPPAKTKACDRMTGPPAINLIRHCITVTLTFIILRIFQQIFNHNSILKTIIQQRFKQMISNMFKQLLNLYTDSQKLTYRRK